MKQKRYRIPAVQEGTLLLLLGGWLLGYSIDAYNHSYIKDWAQSPSLFPLVVAGLLALLGVVILGQGLKEEAPASGQGGRVREVILLLGMSLAYYLALSVIRLPYLAVTLGTLSFAFSTFELATVVFLAAMMFYLGVRSKPVLIALPLGMTAFLSVMFRTLLHVLLP